MKKISLQNLGLPHTPVIVEMFVHDHEQNSPACIANHEMFNVRFLQQRLRPDSNFVDVGGYEGYFSLIASTIIKTGTIWTFEPVQGSFDVIRANVALARAQNIRARNIAISDKSNTDGLIVWREGAQCASSTFERPRDNNVKHHDTVPTFSLDDLLDIEFKDKQIDVMKVDIEGAEVELFAGSKRFFERNPDCKVMLELHCMYIRPRTDVRLKDFLDMLWADFNVFDAEMKPMPQADYQLLYTTGGANLVLTKK